MQQTTKYKLNLIEKTDTFSPDPLNQNTQKVENALSAATAHTDAGDRAEASARASADAAITTAYQSADAAVTAAFQSADAAVTAAFQSADAALDRRIQVFEARHFASGITTGRTMNLGFTPKVLLISAGSSGTYFCVPGAASSHSNIIEGGFRQSLADHANYAAWG